MMMVILVMMVVMMMMMVHRITALSWREKAKLRKIRCRWTSKNRSCPISKTGINIVQTDNFAVFTWNPTKWLHITSELSVSTKTSHLRFLLRRAHTRRTFFFFCFTMQTTMKHWKPAPLNLDVLCEKWKVRWGERNSFQLFTNLSSDSFLLLPIFEIID